MAMSTNGSVTMLGKHYNKSWSSSQKTVALRHGKAKLIAVVNCSCEATGMFQLAEDWWMKLEGEVLVDSSAALGVVARKGACKLRHVRVVQLCVHHNAETG